MPGQLPRVHFRDGVLWRYQFACGRSEGKQTAERARVTCAKCLEMMRRQTAAANGSDSKAEDRV